MCQGSRNMIPDKINTPIVDDTEITISRNGPLDNKLAPLLLDKTELMPVYTIQTEANITYIINTEKNNIISP
jgi:hypothetical protein